MLDESEDALYLEVGGSAAPAVDVARVQTGVLARFMREVRERA